MAKNLYALGLFAILLSLRCLKQCLCTNTGVDKEYSQHGRNAKLAPIKLVQKLRGHMLCGFIVSVNFENVSCIVYSLMFHWICGMEQGLSFWYHSIFNIDAIWSNLFSTAWEGIGQTLVWNYIYLQQMM